MSTIAKSAKANQSMIHYYYNTKENLYVEVLNRLFGVNKTSHNLSFDGFGELNQAQKLYIAIFFMVNLHFDAYDKDFNKIIAIELSTGRKHLKNLVKKNFVPRIEKLVEIIKEGAGKGEFVTDEPYFVVMSILSNLIFFESNRDNYIGTSLYDELYGADYRSRLLNFMLVSIFKMLSPRLARDVVPSLPRDVEIKLQELIHKFKNNQSED